MSNNYEEGFFIQLFHLETGDSVIFDDNGKVAYAYLVQADSGITSDVWLYNSDVTPVEPEWKDHAKMPFLNPLAFVTEKTISPIKDEQDIEVGWLDDGSGKIIGADLLLRGELCGRLLAGSRPGWAKLARKDGPLARVLVISDW